MKILFIYPNAGSQVGFNYGVAHLAAVLQQAGHEVVLWQFCEELAPLPTQVELTDRLKQLSPDLIGFSVVTNQWAYALEIAGWIKEASTVPLLFGGVHALAAGEEVLRSMMFDYIMVGEAEEALLEFVERLEAGQDLTSVRNLGWLDKGEVCINPVRPLPELTRLPVKDYSIFDFQRLIDAKQGWVGIMASRGCPFSCTYCFNHQMVKHYRKDLDCSFGDLKYIRHFDVEQVVGEIDYLLHHYERIKMFIFDDDLFTFYPEYVTQFCEAYQKVSSLPFVVNAHVGFFDEDRARNLAAANCRIVKFGVESGSPRIRKEILNRHMSNEAIAQAMAIAKAHGMHTSVFLMIGLPNETEDDLLATIKLMAETQPGRYRWTYFFPFPNTQAYDLAMKSEGIQPERMANLKNFTNASCLDFGPKHNLLLEKVGKIMPWFVNAYSDLPVAGVYRERVDTLIAMDRQEWDDQKDGILEEDRLLSARFVKEGLSHYAVKYNPFMGVISDYFTSQE